MALSDNLVSYWKMDEASGNAVDSHGSNTLTDNGSVGSASGNVGNARDFEASTIQYFSIADNADLSVGDVDCTFNCWVNLESLTAGQAIVGKYNFGANQREYTLQLNGSGNRFRLVYSGTGTSGSVLDANAFGAPSTGTWYMVTWWHDSVADQVGICVNAGTANTASISGGIFDGTSEFRIGSQNSGDVKPWDGLIDEVGWWKRKLSSAEITELYNSGSGRDYSYITGGAAGQPTMRRFGLCRHVASMNPIGAEGVQVI